MRLSNTGKNIRPCAAPKITIPKYIRKKNTSKIWVLANASTTIPIIFVNVIPENTCNEESSTVNRPFNSKSKKAKKYIDVTSVSFLYISI